MPNLPAVVKRAKKLRKITKLLVILDTKPVPVCELTRMRRCKKIKGKLYKGNNGNKEWFGYKLGLIVDIFEQPISFTIMPASRHDINALKGIIG